MIDSIIRSFLEKKLDSIAFRLIKMNVNADFLTYVGLLIGIASCFMALLEFYLPALVLLVVNRLIDGLDGPVARVGGESSDFGGYLDILCDFIVYAGFPLAVAVGLATAEALYAVSFLLFSMIICSVSFLAYAVIAEKQKNLINKKSGKSFFFSFGLMEGTETIVFLCLICIWPIYFVQIATIFGILCLATAILRTITTYRNFKNN